MYSLRGTIQLLNILYELTNKYVIKYTSALLFLLIHKATCFGPSVGHLQAYIADYVIGAECTSGVLL